MLGRALPWDVYTASGVLIATAGMTLADPAQLARLTARPLFRQAGDDDTGSDLPDRLALVMRDYPLVLRQAGTHDLEPSIRDLLRVLTQLLHDDHDATLGLIRLMPMRDAAARHTLLATLMVLDLSARARMDEDARTSVAAASLTMNIAAMRLHADLAEGRVGFDPQTRDDLTRHPEYGARLLEASGVTDPIWLTAVRQHHEHLDGSGYPHGLRDDDISLGARLLRVADVYAARISGRRYRAPKSPLSAYKHLFGGERGRIDAQVALLLPRQIGLYPPGTLVRLANREVAVVLRREGTGENAGHVMAFMEARGRLLKLPVERDTALVSYAVVGVTEVEPTWPAIDWPVFWGYPASLPPQPLT